MFCLAYFMKRVFSAENESHLAAVAISALNKTDRIIQNQKNRLGLTVFSKRSCYMLKVCKECFLSIYCTTNKVISLRFSDHT